MNFTSESATELSNIIEAYVGLRKRVYAALQANGGFALGPDAWLRNAIDEDQVQFTATSEGIDFYGTCYSMQTQSSEFFSGFLAYDDLAAVE